MLQESSGSEGGLVDICTEANRFEKFQGRPCLETKGGFNAFDVAGDCRGIHGGSEGREGVSRRCQLHQRVALGLQLALLLSPTTASKSILNLRACNAEHLRQPTLWQGMPYSVKLHCFQG